ncbi:MAG TPA: arylsulfatase [Bacteroides sp.]|nr:arylsulfatase [Bacteroides sp.]
MLRKNLFKLIPVVLIALLIILGSCGQGSEDKASPDRLPNIIFIMADDLGYAEAGCYGQSIIKTPAIDRISEEGMKFTRFYAGSPVCAPSRSVLMTGMHTGHTYIRDNGDPADRDPDLPFPGQNPIPDSILTIAEIMKEQGYVTGCMGKWGLGHTNTSGDPGNQGFDLFYGYKCQRHAHSHYPNFLWRNNEMEELEGNDRSLVGAQHSQDLFTLEALNFIQENRDTSFFLYLPFIIPHLSIQTTDRFLDMYKEIVPEADYVHRGYLQHPYPHAAYAGMITQMDDAIGQVLDQIDKLGLEEETIIFFTSDNGPAYDRLGGSDSDFFNSSGPLQGRKGSLLEGGIRVPLVVKWTGKISAGSLSEIQSALWDILPTLCEVSGSEIPENTDGISILPALLSTGEQKKHESLYWEFPSYGGQAALIKGDWKLLVRNLYSEKETVSVQLFNLNDDVGEKNDLATENPELITEMLQEMSRSHVHSDLFGFHELEDFYTLQKQIP